ncbi:RNA polymerase sigma factor SigF [Streptomyces triticagri]|uniref:RNA polymerase sigma factor SigF n=1 Tax=Streptomyces triticagri TaxID=2293568 RepID=A0A372LWU4_9ACTN|nr:RNA polymerase sigma factor SigF [Streptomyces triticagri]RFU82487.1 RNA polymerase sigma factor SigF [Streptomyces triticagri]
MVTRVSSSSTAAAARPGPPGSGSERHTGGRPLPDAGLHSVAGQPATADVRRLSRSLFTRLGQLQEGTPEFAYVRNSLVELNLNLVHYAAARLRPRPESHEDVVQVGTIGLIKAIDRFDLQRGVEFTSFALPTVIGEIKRFFRDTTWAVHVPRRLQELRIDLARATAELEQRYGRRPTTAELADRLDLEPAEVTEGLAAANGYTATSLDFPAESPDFDDTIADHIGYHDPELALVEDLHTLKPLIAALSERERRILALRFVADMTQSEIGEEIGVTQMHVSRLLTRILATLRKRMERQTRVRE